jgi:hypothetical protein
MPEQPAAIYDERRANHTCLLASFQLLLLKHAIALADFAVRVREQLHAKTVLVPESAVGHAIVETYTEHDRMQAREVVFELTELESLQSAAGCIVTGIKIENDIPMILELVKSHYVEVRIGQVEWRRRLPRLQFDSLFASHQLHVEPPLKP